MMFFLKNSLEASILVTLDYFLQDLDSGQRQEQAPKSQTGMGTR